MLPLPAARSIRSQAAAPIRQQAGKQFQKQTSWAEVSDSNQKLLKWVQEEKKDWKDIQVLWEHRMQDLCVQLVDTTIVPDRGRGERTPLQDAMAIRQPVICCLKNPLTVTEWGRPKEEGERCIEKERRGRRRKLTW
jgi:hypothetical protein